MKLPNDDRIEIVKAVLINVDSGEEWDLSEKTDRNCHFINEPLRVGDYHIRLRLDWSDMKNGVPMLDADIWTETGGRKRFLPKSRPSHHTEKKLDGEIGRKVYTFEFEGLRLRLDIRKDVAASFSERVCVKDSVTMVLKKGGSPLA